VAPDGIVTDTFWGPADVGELILAVMLAIQISLFTYIYINFNL
jgi:hypothetical protein